MDHLGGPESGEEIINMLRSDIKKIVKECLVEILNEGLAGTLQASTLIRNNNQVNSPSVFSEKTRPNPVQQTRQQSAGLREAVRRESGGNKIMEAILADTAASTLPKMLKNDRPGMSSAVNGGAAEQVVAASNPEDLFGEDVSSKWANLAFSSSNTKK